MFKHVLLTICFVLCVFGSVWADDSQDSGVTGNDEAYNINTHGGKIETEDGNIDTDDGDIDANRIRVNEQTPKSNDELSSKYYVDKEDDALEDKLDDNTDAIERNGDMIQDLANELKDHENRISNLESSIKNKADKSDLSDLEKYVDNKFASFDGGDFYCRNKKKNVYVKGIHSERQKTYTVTCNSGETAVDHWSIIKRDKKKVWGEYDIKTLKKTDTVYKRKFRAIDEVILKGSFGMKCCGVR